MNFYEEYLLKLQKRARRLEENPELGRLKSNSLRYEIAIENTREQLEAWQKGKPFSDGGGFTAGNLVKSMGFTPSGSVTTALQTQQPQKYLKHASAMGLPVESSCDMTMMPFAMMECGDVPMEDLAICDQHACTPMMLRGIHVAHTSRTLTYFIDIPFEQNEDSLKYVAAQLVEFIKFAEKNFPGIKYDESRLIEMQSFTEEGRRYSDEIYYMLRNRPCPIGGLDAFSVMEAMSRKGVEYLRLRRDEVAERVEKKMGAVEGEKLRMLWAVTRPFFMNPFKVLEKWKVVVPLHYSGPVAMQAPLPARNFYGDRKLSPLEKVAANVLLDQWGHRGDRWVNDMIWVCRDLRIDAIINYCMLGCTATLGLKKIVEDAAERELGIPTLQLEGKQWDTDYASETVLTARLEEFAQMCLSQKGLD
ncbi:MAG: 2-hydroxyacyl-CoA dehydratase [Dehalococcoidales bacterium]|nr:2-hydroxyacyl-CoA dehydratase [Dehalococcoidales bacterium]